MYEKIYQILMLCKMSEVISPRLTVKMPWVEFCNQSYKYIGMIPSQEWKSFCGYPVTDHGNYFVIGE